MDAFSQTSSHLQNLPPPALPDSSLSLTSALLDEGSRNQPYMHTLIVLACLYMCTDSYRALLRQTFHNHIA